MSDEELEEHLQSARLLDEHDYRNPDDEDDWFAAKLYETTDGRLFRYVELSGFNSVHNGAGNIGEWIDSREGWTNY